jgi:hypothetical protein
MKKLGLREVLWTIWFPYRDFPEQSCQDCSTLAPLGPLVMEEKIEELGEK